MESILFFSRYFVGKSTDNLATKFRNQISATSKMGFDVWYVAIEDDIISLYHGDNKHFLCKLKTNKLPIISEVYFYHQFYRSVLKLVKVKGQFDFVYARSMFSSNMTKRALRALRNTKAKIIMEIPSHGVNELKSEKRVFRKAILHIASKLNKKMSEYVDLYALIGGKASQFNGKPAVNILNGIDVDSVPLRKPINEGGVIHILVLASMARWHGYDRLLEGLRNYEGQQNSPALVIHFVGSEGDGSLSKWKELVDRYNLNSIVHFEGSKYGDELSDFFNLCDIGVASLGLHRISDNMIYTLKIREYMARGLPFVYAAEDDSLEERADYYIKVPNDDSPIDIEIIVAFANKNKLDSVGPKKMREYAKTRMTWESQFSTIFNWFHNQDL